MVDASNDPMAVHGCDGASLVLLVSVMTVTITSHLFLFSSIKLQSSASVKLDIHEIIC